MPSISSTVFSSLFNQSYNNQSLADFNLDKMRKQLARVDALVPEPRGVDIEAKALGHCDAEWIYPPFATDRTILYFPGGAWMLRTPRVHRRIAARLARAVNANILLVFYRLAPEHLFPAGLDDCTDGYDYLLESGTDPSRIVVGGDSAGGNLALATVLTLRDRGRPLPAGVFGLSAVTDLSDLEGGPKKMSHAFNAPASNADIRAEGIDPRSIYVGEDLARLDHPYVSPIRGDLKGLCPVLLQVGSSEFLLEHSTQFVERACAAGVNAEVEVWEGQPHVWHGLPFPESEQAFGHLSDFIRHHCP